VSSSGTVVATPMRLFREEAQTESIACPSCGGPITRGIFGSIETIACPYCGSHLAPQDSGALAIMLEVRRQQRQSALALHMRAELAGATWEVVGIQWREVIADGTAYPWQEFLLFNPYLGYRYLLYFVYDRHWALGTPLDGAPVLGTFFTRKIATFGGTKYRHFQSSVARVTYVEGEFPWQVRAGDSATADDYVAPPYGLSIETTRDENGTDIAYTRMEHLDAQAVWAAFKLPGRPPALVGIGPLRPNRWKQGNVVTWLSFAALFALWTIVSITYSASRDSVTVFERTADITEPMTEEIDLGPTGNVTAVEIELAAHPLSNAWAFAEVLLVPLDSDEAFGAAVEADEWHGVDGGESWSEGNPRNTVVIGGVPTGKYTLQVNAQAGQGTDTKPPAGLRYTVKIRRDVVLLRYVFIPLLVIVLIPLMLWLFGAIVEGQRWKNSDYAPNS
jgi:DNA-directed RNA polymerase subunit RPC12/RpoP